MRSSPAGSSAYAGQIGVIRSLVQSRAIRPVREIAVVGNAPLAPSPERARAIDAADVVVRMTTFDVDHDVERLGTRTDVVVVHRATVAGPATWHDCARRVYLVAEPGRRHYEPQNPTRWWPADAAPVPISNRDIVDELNRELGYRRRHALWATTGLVALWTMHRAFPEAHITFTGTSLLDQNPGRGHRFDHAWGPSVPVTPEHRLASETRLLQRAMLDGWVTVYPENVAATSSRLAGTR